MPAPPPDSDSLDPQRPNADLLLWAYPLGIFPMADSDTGEIGWYSPDPRGIIPLDAFRVPRSLRRVVRKAPFEIRSDTAFVEVMRACAAPRPQEPDTWIDDRLLDAYVELHRRGHARSIEARRDGRLVGGLYGVDLDGAFFGESMFVRPARGGTDASKVCLVHLVEHLIRRGYRLLDTQFTNPHLDQFGCVEISRAAYLARLRDAVGAATWGTWGGVGDRPPPPGTS